MPTFKYAAKNEASQNVSGKIVADNKDSVVEELRKRKLLIVSVEEVRETSATQSSFQRRSVKGEELVIFARQLATMVEAGIPILQGINALQEQTSNLFFKKILSTIELDIQHGSNLTVAFSKHPKVFDALFVNMIKVGETGGVLSQVLDRVASYMEKSLKLKNKVKAALTYPAVIVSMAGLITIGLLVKVVPTFAGIYDSFDRELPAMTKLLIDVSDGLVWILPWMAVSITGLGFFLRWWYKKEQGARFIDGLILKAPIVGDILRKVCISRFSRTLSTLVQSGVPILESLNVLQKSIGNKVLEDVVEDVKNNVREGESIAAPLEKSKVFPSMVTRMISIGEKSGKLDKMLFKISEFYDDQVDAAVDGLTSVIEPIIIGFLGIVIGFIVVALFMPVFSMVQFV